ncbi:MAG: PduL/EutD family phosphate acyltransferase [Enterocloster bolteae]
MKALDQENQEICQERLGLEPVGPKGTVSRCRRERLSRFATISYDRHSRRAMWSGDRRYRVEVETFGERHGVFGDVLIRVSDQFELEMHVDVMKPIACALKNNDYNHPALN